MVLTGMVHSKSYAVRAALLACLVNGASQAWWQSSLVADLAETRAAIRTAEEESSKYSGGLVKTLIDLRTSTLRYTEAMLNQKHKAVKNGISVTYVVDGKTAKPSGDALVAALRLTTEIAGLDERIAQQEAEVAKYSGGLVRSMGLSTVATMRQTRALLEQKMLLLRHGMPQYILPIGAGPVNQEAVPQPRRSEPEPRAEPTRKWVIDSVDMKQVESNSSWTKFAWKVTVRNDSDNGEVFGGKVEFIDSDRFVLDDSPVPAFAVGARSVESASGYSLINADLVSRVANIQAKLSKQ